MLAEVSVEEKREEDLIERIETLETKLANERKARQSVEKDADKVQDTLDKAIDYRKSKRAAARDYLQQWVEEDDG